MTVLATLFNFVFGCHHSHLSRVFTIERQSYRVCCDCGAKFKYSLETMLMEQRVATSEAQSFASIMGRSPIST